MKLKIKQKHLNIIEKRMKLKIITNYYWGVQFKGIKGICRQTKIIIHLVNPVEDNLLMNMGHLIRIFRQNKIIKYLINLVEDNVPIKINHLVRVYKESTIKPYLINIV